jgi:hypothetical protein
MPQVVHIEKSFYELTTMHVVVERKSTPFKRFAGGGRAIIICRTRR